MPRHGLGKDLRVKGLDWYQTGGKKLSKLIKAKIWG